MKRLFSVNAVAVCFLFFQISGCAVNRKNNTAGDIVDKINVIKKMGDKQQTRSIKYLIQEFENSDSDAIRVEAAKSLGKIGDIKAIPIFEEALTCERNKSIRIAAKNALARIKEVNSVNNKNK